MVRESSKKPIRVRFAPSPTGQFHIGSARTTLFNWLFAKKEGGAFILRIEDTDIERSKQEFENVIFESIKWLGLNWDEGPDIGGDYGPYRQSERLDIYEKYLNQLFEKEKVYYCFCSKEQLEEDRQAMLVQGLSPKYTGRCRNINKTNTKKRIAEGESSVIRFKVADSEVEFNDLIRGKIKTNTSLLGDIVIAKNLRQPLYNFAAVVDDYLMEISHVIRGEEHTSNTPKQILIATALGFDIPKFAHLPLILSEGRKKMSKRTTDEISLSDYKREGYLPDALVNFLAFLGWHPEDEQEIMNREELINKFDLKKVQKAGALFNIEKLEWINAQYLKNIPARDLAKELSGFIPEEWSGDKELLIKAVEVEKDRIKKLSDFKNFGDFFFKLPDYEIELLAWPRNSNINKEKTLNNLKLLSEEINKIFKADFNKESLEKKLAQLTEVWGRGELLWPLRAALSGKEFSPGPFEIMDVLGKEETVKRIEIAINKLM